MRKIAVTTALSFFPGALANALISTPAPLTTIGARYTGELAVGWEGSTVKWITAPGVSDCNTMFVSPANRPGLGENVGSAATPGAGNLFAADWLLAMRSDEEPCSALEAL